MHQAVLQDAVQHQRIDVPARKHRDDWTLPGVSPPQQCRDPNRTGWLHHQLCPFHQQQQCPGDLLLGNRQHLLHGALHQRQGDVARPGDGDTVGHRLHVTERGGHSQAQRLRVGCRALGLDADDLRGVHCQGGDGRPDARQQSTSSGRHQHVPGVRNLLQDL